MKIVVDSDHEALRAHVRAFATREILPVAAALDREATFPDAIVKRMGELGFLGLMVPTEFGGSGLDTISYVILMEEISRACASCGVIASVNNSLFCEPVASFGTDAQKADVLTKTASGRMLGAFALTEPESGSDARTMRTVAERDERGGYVLNGSKNFITNGPNADTLLVFAVTKRDPTRPEHTGFLVPKGTPGLTIGHHDQKLGIRAAHSASVFFENVHLPSTAVLGEVGAGFRVALHTLDGGRIGIAAQALGIAAAAYDAAIAFAKERQAFGGPISKFQAIQFKCADMRTRLESARLLTYRAAAMKDAKVRFTVEAAMAKLAASETATYVAHQSLQIHGGYGFTLDYPAERHYRDARVTEIYEGTSEIQRVVIGADSLR